MAFAQFRILFKKNFLLRRRQPVLFLFELVWPLLLFSIVAIVRKTSPIQNRPACYYNPMPLPNSGTIGFLQSFLCNTNVSCRLKPFDAQTSSLKNYLPSVYDGILGLTKTEGVNKVFYNLPNLTQSVEQINQAFNESFFEKILNGSFTVSDLFDNLTQLKTNLFNEGMPNDLIESIFRGSINLTDLYENFNETINFQPFCEENFLKHVLTVDNLTDANELIRTLCQLNLKNLLMDVNFITNNLNRSVINQYFENISSLFNNPELNSKISELKSLQQTIEQLSIYGNLLKNLPNITEIARILPRLVQIIELVQNQQDLIQLFGQIMSDLNILTNNQVILELYEITRMFIDFLQRYHNMTEDLTADQLFRNSSLVRIFESDLTAEKAYEKDVLASKINYLVLSEFLVGKLTGVAKYRLFCLQPGYWTLFIVDDNVSKYLKSRVDNYCGISRDFNIIFDQFFNGIRFDQLQNYFLDMKFSLTAFQGLANMFSTVNKVGSFENDVRLTMESVSAVSELLSRTKTAGLNLYSTYNFFKQITRTFNPNILEMPIIKTLDIAIPILTPLVNIDQIVSLITGIPRGTIDNIINQFNEINNFLTTPQSTRMIRLTTTSPMRLTTTRPKVKSRYIDWSTLFNPRNLPKSFVIPRNIVDYTQWIQRQKRQVNLLDSSIPDFVKMFNSFSPEALEFLCIEPFINLIPDDPVLNYVFGVGRLFELINTFMTIITSTNDIHCYQNANRDYAEISQFLRLNKTVGIFRELIENHFQSKFSCSLVIDVIKNIQKYQNLVDTMQHHSISLETIDCFKQTLLQTLERLKILPGLVRFILSDISILRTIREITPLLELLLPSLSSNTYKFVQLNDFIENANNLTEFIQTKKRITGLDQWYFNTKLKDHLKLPTDLREIFCNRNQLGKYVYSFNDLTKDLESHLCTSDNIYNETYHQFVNQYGKTIQLKKFNGLNIERLVNELPMIQQDFQLLINENQWLIQIINQINQDTLTPLNIYKLFRNFTGYLPEFRQFKKNVSNLAEKYFWILPDESTQNQILSILRGLDLLENLTLILQNNLNGLSIKDMFQDFSIIANRLMKTYNVPNVITELLGQARLFQDPTFLFNSYSDYQRTVCDVRLLNETIMKLWPYVKFSNVSIENFSKYACESSIENQMKIVNLFYHHFLLPEKLQGFFRNGGSSILDLVNMDEKEINIFKQVGPIVTNMNELLKRVKRLDDISEKSDVNDKLTKITNIFCAEIDKGITPQRLVVEENDENKETIKDVTKINQTDLNSQKALEFTDEDNQVDCSDIRRTIEKSSDVGYIVWPLIKPLLLGKILYAPATPVSNAIIAKINKTFEELDQLHQFAKTWVESPMNLTSIFGDLQQTNNIKKLLSNRIIQQLLHQIFGLNSLDLQSIKSMLENLQGQTNIDVLKTVEMILKQFSDYLPCIELNRFEALQTESELVERAKELHRNRLVIAGIVFSNLNSSNPNANFLPPHMHIKIRMDVDSVRNTEQLTSWLFFPGPENDYFRELHYLRGFIQLQDLIERAVIDLHFEDSEQHPTNPVVYMQLMPYPCYRGDPGKESSYVNYFILPILGTLMWTATLGVSIKNLMRERERHVEETMRIMGLNSTINFISWLISSFIPMIIVSIVVAIVLKYGGIFPASDFTITITPLLTLALSALMLGYLVSSFFTKANLATLCGILIYFISYLPFILIMFLDAKMKIVHKILISLSSATAFGYASIYLTRFEYQGEGLQWQTFFSSIFPNDQMNFGLACTMMMVDSILYGLIGKYVRSILPGKNARRKPFWYPCVPLTWCFWKRNSKRNDGFYLERDHQANPFTARMKQIDPNNEQEPINLTVGISFENVSKQFGENKKAVENLSLKLYENQITALLGHNGAGKTTTINVLTGIYPPTNGTATIYGRDITTDYDQIRKNVGLCPQEDILFDFMTVREHLQFYGRLKGNMSSKELDRDINELLSSMGLWIFQHERVSSLSGGVRRRVSVSIAFVAGSRTVILDEPTSGVDPCARRSIWEVIFKHRAGRTILLTTHYLDEADTLSDRIAIIHQGRLLCSGSSMFLKKRFGKGYSLTIDLKFKLQQKLKIINNQQLNDIKDFLCKQIPDVTLREHIGSEITYSLKYEHREKFENLFKQLELNKEKLSIGNYGLSDTTLEEVFLWVTELADQGKMDDSLENSTVPKIVIDPTPPSSSHSDDSGVGIESNATLDGISTISGSSGHLPPISHSTLTPLTKQTKITGRKLYFHQFQSLLLKRFHHTKRNWKVFLSHIFLPLLFVAMSMGFTLLRPSQIFQRPWLLTPAMYDQSAMFVR